MVATTYYYAYRLDLQSIGENVEMTTDGFVLMRHAVAILVFAGRSARLSLRSGQVYVSGCATAFLSPELPIIGVLLVGTFMAFTGDSWAAMGSLTPIAIPIAWELTG